MAEFICVSSPTYYPAGDYDHRGLSLPASLLSRFAIDRFRIYVQAANLFTITKYEGLDPELQSSDINQTVGFGIDQGNYPHTPAFLIGVNLNF